MYHIYPTSNISIETKVWNMTLIIIPFYTQFTYRNVLPKLGTGSNLDAMNYINNYWEC